VAGLADNYCRAVASQSRAAARYHGNQAAVAVAARHGRTVDEAFGDAIPGEPASLAAESLPDLVVLRCDTFVGLDGEYLRAAVRTDWPVLVDAIAEALR
jgi:hypothetical protein